MLSDSSGWLLLLVDVSLKATLLAALASVGLTLFRVRNSHVRHRVWTAVLLGMLVMPLLVKIVPGLSIPVPGLAWISNSTTDPDPELASTINPIESNSSPTAGEPIATKGSVASEGTVVPWPTEPMILPPVDDVMSQPLPVSGIEEASTEPELEIADAIATPFSWRVIGSTFIAGLVATYAAIVMILATRLLIGVLRAAWLIRASSPVTSARNLATTTSDGVLYESASIRVPITVGTLRPRVLLPVGWQEWSQDKLDAVLQHELTHIARGDYAVNLLAECNRCIYWFHPLAWCLIRWLSDLAERNCDDAVIASTGDRTSYARHLLEIAATVVDSPRGAMRPGVSMARSADVETRIDAILDMDRPLSKRLGWKSTACLVAAMLPAFWLAAALRAETTKELEAEAIVAVESDNEPKEEEPTTSRAKVTGRITDTQGLSVANASLSLVLYSHLPDRDRKPTPPTTVWDTAKSDAEGRFSLDYPAINDPEFYTKRAYRLVAIAQKEGHGLAWKYIEFSDQATVAEISLPEDQVRRGRLVGLEGQPIVGATIHVIGVGKPPPKWSQFRKWPIHDGMPADEAIDTTIPVDENDRLWPDLIRFRLPPFAVRTWPKSVTSDDNGLFEIRGVAVGQPVEFHVYGTDQGGSVEHSFGTGGGVLEPVTFALDEPRTITGVVTDKVTGKPIAGAKVRVDSAGAIMVMARFPVVADWKGRQGHLGNLHALQHGRNMYLMPAAFATTDADGQYRISAFRNRRFFQDIPFAITVSSPDESSYLPMKKTILWPKKATFTQRADLQLTLGVRVSGQIVSRDGEPVPRARVDFWSRELLYPHEQIESSVMLPGLSPDGIQHPHWRKSDGEGRFELIVPQGESYLFVNRDRVETIVDRIDAQQVGLPDREVRIPSPISSVLAPRTSVEPHRFYPDRAVLLNYGTDKESDELTIPLHQEAPTLTVEVVQPDGSPANDLVYMGGQAPFRFYALHLNRQIQKIGDNKYSIACYDLHSPVSLAFLARGNGLGLHTEIAVKDVGDNVVTLTLQPLGQAKARFVGKDNKPLNAFRPLMWMSLPRKPFSTAADLEEQVVSQSDYLPLQTSFDSIWTGVLHKHMHGPLKTDPKGDATFKALIPGATYRVSQFGGEIKDFRVEPGQTVDLGELVVHDPDATAKLPKVEPAPQPKENASSVNPDALLVDSQQAETAESKPTPSNNAKTQSATPNVEATQEDPNLFTYRGRVVDSDGQPVAGARVAVVYSGYRATSPGSNVTNAYHENYADVVTDGEGNFQVEFSDSWTRTVRVQGTRANQTSNGSGPGTVIIASAKGLAPAWISTADADPDKPLELALQRGSEPIAGRLVSLEGTPLVGVKVSLKSLWSAQEGEVDRWLRELPKLRQQGVLPDGKVDVMKTSFRSPVGRYPAHSHALANTPGLPTQVETDSQGRFTLPHIGDDRLAVLLLEGSQIVTEHIAVVTRTMEPVEARTIGHHGPSGNKHYGASFGHVAEPSIAVVGTVRDEESGKPIAATLSVRRRRGNYVNEVTYNELRTDAEGRYRIEGLPKGKGLSLRVVPNADQPYFAETFNLPEVHGLQPQTFDVTMRRGVTIAGKLTDKRTGQPIRWARFDYFPLASNENAQRYTRYQTTTRSLSPMGYRFMSEEDGSFDLVGMPGEGIIAVAINDPKYLKGVGAEKLGHLKDNQADRLATYDHCTPRLYNVVALASAKRGAERIVVDIQADAGEPIVFEVVDPDGQPLTNYTIDRHHDRTAVGNKSTVYGFVEGRTRTVYFRDRSAKLGKAVTINELPKVRTRKLVLEPYGTITGRLVKREGEPAIVGTVNAYEEPIAGAENAPNHAVGHMIGTTNVERDGRFEIKELLVGAEYRLTVPELGNRSRTAYRSDRISVKPGKTIELGVINVETGDVQPPKGTDDVE